jgi:hypothetical protein
MFTFFFSSSDGLESRFLINGTMYLEVLRWNLISRILMKGATILEDVSCEELLGGSLLTA